MRPIIVAPSILAADFRRLGEEIRALAVEAGANAIVAGSAIFGSGDYAAAIARIRNSTLHRKAVAQ